MRKSYLLISLFFFIAIIATGQEDYRSASEECGKLKYYESQQCMLGKSIFEFESVAYDGRKINSADFRGKVVVINFWFMSCTPCMAELNGLNEIVDLYKDKNVEFISFTLDTKAVLKEDFYPTYDFKFAVIPGSESFLFEGLKHGWGFPTTFIVDQDGNIQRIISGGSSEEKIANQEIKENIIPELERLLNE